MSGTSSPLAHPGTFGAVGPPVSPSMVNSIRINAVADRLASHFQGGSGNRNDAVEFYNLCLSLSRGIDYAIANGEIPGKAQDLPMLMKQLCQRTHDDFMHGAVMVLMISVKNACKIGWFPTKESEELCTIANEIGKVYCSLGSVNAGLSSCHSTVLTIMERFYPKMKLGPIFASIEAKPGYGASTVDFHITKSTVLQDKIWLFVAQTDNVETSTCLISPQQVNFLLNGKGVDRRTTALMDTGPQMPTNVTGMLKFGTNLLQAVGQFTGELLKLMFSFLSSRLSMYVSYHYHCEGHYVILIAYMSVTSLPEHQVLQDYVQPAVTSVDSDSDIIEGPSQISLNCPISFKRIKTPVKGRSCKHFQCFDFDNFININSRRPSWRCPHCNQHVCYADIRLDQNMVEILKDVGENIAEVIVLADGSWKAVLENDNKEDKTQNQANNCEKEQTEPQESPCSPSTVPDVMDLTNDDDQMVIMDTCETADRKPLQASVQNQFVTPSSTSLTMNSAGINQNVAAQIEDNFPGVYIASGRSDTPTVGVSEPPVQPDPPAFNQEAEGHVNNPTPSSFMLNQLSAESNVQLLNYMNSAANEYGRSPSIARHNINRTPVAVQALPVQSSALGPQQNLRSNLNSLLPSGSPATPRVPFSNAATADGFNAILSDTERQQHFSQTPINLPQASGVNSSTLQHPSATQNRATPGNMSTPSQLQNPFRLSGPLGDFRNPHLQQALNQRPLQPMQSSNTMRSHIQQGGQQPGIAQAPRQSSPVSSVQNQTSTAATSYKHDIFRGLTGDQRGSVGGTAQSVSRPDDLFNPQAEQDWRPTARMRGSLLGRQYSDDVRQRIIAPTQPVQSSRPQGPQLAQRAQQGQQPAQWTQQGQQPAQWAQQGQQPAQWAQQGQQPVQRSLGQQPTQRPQGPPQSVQSSRPQGPLPVRSTGVSPQLDVLIANNKIAHNKSSDT